MGTAAEQQRVELHDALQRADCPGAARAVWETVVQQLAHGDAAGSLAWLDHDAFRHGLLDLLSPPVLAATFAWASCRSGVASTTARPVQPRRASLLHWLWTLLAPAVPTTPAPTPGRAATTTATTTTTTTSVALPRGLRDGWTLNAHNVPHDSPLVVRNLFADVDDDDEARLRALCFYVAAVRALTRLVFRWQLAFDAAADDAPTRDVLRLVLEALLMFPADLLERSSTRDASSVEAAATIDLFDALLALALSWSARQAAVDVAQLTDAVAVQPAVRTAVAHLSAVAPCVRLATQLAIAHQLAVFLAVAPAHHASAASASTRCAQRAVLQVAIALATSSSTAPYQREYSPHEVLLLLRRHPPQLCPHFVGLILCAYGTVCDLHRHRDELTDVLRAMLHPRDYANAVLAPGAYDKHGLPLCHTHLLCAWARVMFRIVCERYLVPIDLPPLWAPMAKPYCVVLDPRPVSSSVSR